MACDYLANPLANNAPISCFQVASHKTYQLYSTKHTSYVLLCTSTYIYLLTAEELKSIVGMWPLGKRNPSGLDRSQQLDTFPDL